MNEISRPYFVASRGQVLCVRPGPYLVSEVSVSEAFDSLALAKIEAFEYESMRDRIATLADQNIVLAAKVETLQGPVRNESEHRAKIMDLIVAARRNIRFDGVKAVRALAWPIGLSDARSLYMAAETAAKEAQEVADDDSRRRASETGKA
jgi:hypothetical protein